MLRAPLRQGAPSWTRLYVATLLVLTAVILRASSAHAQSARASFLLQMLRGNPDARVRTNAALRLGELHEGATADAMITALAAERDTTVQSTIIAALATIGNPSALPAVQAATRSPSSAVAAQARRALPILQAAQATARAGTPGTSPAGTAPPPSGGPPSVLISVRVSVQTGVAAALQAAAQSALESALSARSEVVLHTGSASQAQSTIRSRRLRGAHQFYANVQSVQPQPTGVRAAVSIVVTTFPGGLYEFDTSSTITVSGGSATTMEAQRGAVAQALNSATGRALTQLLRP